VRVILINYSVVSILILLSCCSYAQENASNPLAAISNTDLRGQFLDLGDTYLNDYFVDGAYMVIPKLKIKYELHYWDTDITGLKENDFESFHLKPIYFPLQGAWGNWKYKLSVGIEWILEFNHRSIGCEENPILCPPYGAGSDQLAPFVGLSLVAPKGTVLIPLIQHFFSYNGSKVNTTAMRLIAIQSLPKGFWAKLDLIVPFDWENDIVPTTTELQFGKMFSSAFGVYIDLMAGIGSHKPYNYGLGLGVRFNY
jgi:hypothetical protein